MDNGNHRPNNARQDSSWYPMQSRSAYTHDGAIKKRTNDAPQNGNSSSTSIERNTVVHSGDNSNETINAKSLDEKELESLPLPPPDLSWRERVRHFTWTWFTMTMATGGIANVLHAVPLRFNGLYHIGVVFLLLNLALFFFNVICISARFWYWPTTFRASLMHPTESLFVPAFVISIALICVNITEYGTDAKGQVGPWLLHTMGVLYWVYVILAVSFTAGIYLLMWSTQTHTISQMTPVWIFPAYPLLLVGPFANVMTRPGPGLKGDHALQVIVGGLIVQGAGFMVSLMVYSAFLYRLMTQKLPAESSRPAMFISVGPAGFTISGLINMAHNLVDVLPADFMGNGALTGQVTKILANWVGLWLWGLCLFWFLVSVGAHYSTVSHGRMKFAMTWYSFIFPNTALCTSTFAVARALDNNKVVQILGCVMTCLLVLTWLFVFGMMIRGVIMKDVLWPQKQEDRDDDYWERNVKAQQLKDADLPVHSASLSMMKRLKSFSPSQSRHA